MRELGYAVTVDEKGVPQIAGIPEEVLGAFSTRRPEIEQVVAAQRARAEAQGKVWTERMEAEAAERAAKQTRRAKPDELDPVALRAGWQKTCLALGFEAEAFVKEANERYRQTPDEARARDAETHRAVKAALDLAIEHLSERQSVFLGD